MKNVCIVGYGAIGPIHAKVISMIEDVKFYAVCDIDSAAIAKCREIYDVVEYDDFDKMLKDENIDAVHICTPHYLHFEMIKKALEAGKDVLSEKPVVMTNTQFDALLETKNAENVGIVFQNRYNPCIQKLKEIITSGEIGEIQAIKGFVTWHRDASYYASGDWRGKWETEGGGVLINQAIHTLDLLVYIAGAVRSVRANMSNYTLKNEIETEDTMNVYMTFESGIRGIFYATNAYGTDSPPEIEVVGSKATARYAYNRLSINGEVVMQDAPPNSGKGYWGRGHETLINDYYTKNKFFSPEDVANSMYTLFGIYDSAKSEGKEIIIGGK